MRLSGILNPVKIFRYIWNTAKFKKIGRRPYFEWFVDCKYTRNVYVGDYCWLSKGVCFVTSGKGKIVIGNNVSFGRHVIVSADSLVEIGDDSMIAEFVSIRDLDHGIEPHRPIRLQGYIIKPIKIGRDVFIGRGTVILKGVAIGDGAVIGANSVVTKDVEPYTLIAGIPAKFIKRRK